MVWLLFDLFVMFLVRWNDKAKSLYYSDFSAYPPSPEGFLSKFADSNEQCEIALGVKLYLEANSSLPAYRLNHVKMLTGCNGKLLLLLLNLNNSLPGYCPLFDLVYLYQVDELHSGFDPLRDTLFDAMHVFFCHGTTF